MDAARTSLERAVQAAPGEAALWRSLGTLHFARQDHGPAAVAFEQALRLDPQSPELYYDLGLAMVYDNRPAPAAGVLARAVQRWPRSARLQWLHARILPIIGRDATQLGQFRGRWMQQLLRLRHLWNAVGEGEARDALGESWDAFHLHYHGLPLVQEQRALGTLLHHLAVRAWPQLAAVPPAPPPGPGEPLRICFVSSLFHFHTVPFLFAGWLRHMDRSRVEVQVVQLGAVEDDMTHTLRGLADRFVHCPDAPFAESVAAIRGGRPHAVVFPDLGMDRRVLRIAALRHAPVQAVGWGHPVTTGLPTLDLFLSSEAMEPPDGAAHYTERLMRLPGLGITPEPIGTIPADRSRADFGLNDSDRVFLVPQSLYKLRPQDDQLYAELCAREPAARLVFLASAAAQASRGVKDTFIARLHGAFSARGLDLSRHLHILPSLSHADFLALNRCADVFLDAPGWSGGRTTLEALQMGLVPVTLPGPLMRQRHTAGILSLLGVTDTVVQSPSAMVEMALRVAKDAHLRAELQRRIAAALPTVLEDRRAAPALEQVLRRSLSRSP